MPKKTTPRPVTGRLIPFKREQSPQVRRVLRKLAEEARAHADSPFITLMRELERVNPGLACYGVGGSAKLLLEASFNGTCERIELRDDDTEWRNPSDAPKKAGA